MQCQRGYALLFLPVLMFAGTATVLQSDKQLIRSTHRASSASNADINALIQARQSLISYAAIYPYLYGPTGAGPGYLPCPDRSIGSTANRAVNTGDGPDPPCATAGYVAGRLPRHISLPGHRYQFHSEPFQRFHYRVAGVVVNNPASAQLNPAAATSRDSASTVVARISTPAVDGDPGGLDRASFPITYESLLQGARPSVAAWVRERAGNGQKHASCAKDEIVSHDEMTDAEVVILYVMDEPLAGQACVRPETDTLRIENVSARRHWFVRNDWLQWVTIEFGQGCRQQALQNCALVYINDKAGDVNEANAQSASHKIRMRWQIST